VAVPCIDHSVFPLRIVQEGCTSCLAAVDYEEFVIESPRGDKRLACRKQLPLKLAWYAYSKCILNRRGFLKRLAAHLTAVSVSLSDTLYSDGLCAILGVFRYTNRKGCPSTFWRLDWTTALPRARPMSPYPEPARLKAFALHLSIRGRFARIQRCGLMSWFSCGHLQRLSYRTAFRIPHAFAQTYHLAYSRLLISMGA
jgi:hypothetical protein